MTYSLLLITPAHFLKLKLLYYTGKITYILNLYSIAVKDLPVILLHQSRSEFLNQTNNSIISYPLLQILNNKPLL